jgi:protein-disulfide isomerase
VKTTSRFVFSLSLLAVVVLPYATARAQGGVEQTSPSTDVGARIEKLEGAVRALGRQFGELSTLLKASLPPLPIEDVEPFELPISRSASRGKETARIAVVEFSDFQCPFCRQNFQNAYPKLVRSYVDSGQLRYVFKNLPLDPIHPLARDAAAAAECARGQGKFWEMHDRLFENQEKLSRSDLVFHAGSIALDKSQFEACLGESDRRAYIQQDVDEATKLGLVATPSFLVGEITQRGTLMVRKKIAGAQPFDVFRVAIEALLSSPEIPR